MSFFASVKKKAKRIREVSVRTAQMNKYPYTKIGNDKPEEIIVSLTSFPKRFPILHHALKSILWQSLKPDRLILYISDDVPQESLPEEVLSLKKYGLEIENREDLKPHTKYLYAMREHPQALIVTVDDDLMYPQDMLEKLYAGYQQFPGCVTAARAHEMKFDAEGKVLPYLQFGWESSLVGKPSKKLLCTGCGGVLYPPRAIRPEFLNETLIKKLALGADDIYLKCAEIVSGTSGVLTDAGVWKNTVAVLHSQEIKLSDKNNGEARNDVYLKNCMDYFGLKREDFTEA